MAAAPGLITVTHAASVSVHSILLFQRERKLGQQRNNLCEVGASNIPSLIFGADGNIFGSRHLLGWPQSWDHDHCSQMSLANYHVKKTLRWLSYRIWYS